MDIALSPDRLVNAGGAFLFLVEGLAILWLGRTSRRGRLVGALAATFGFGLIAENLVDVVKGDIAAGLLVSAAMLPGSVFAMLLAANLARTLSPGGRVAFRWFAALGFAAYLVISIAGTLDAPIRSASYYPTGWIGIALWWVEGAFFTTLGILLAAAALAVRACRPQSHASRRALVHLALAFGLFSVFLGVALALTPFPLTNGTQVTVRIGLLAAAVLEVAAAAALVVPNAGPEPVITRNAFLGLLAAGVAAVTVTLFGGNSFDGAFGLFGVVRCFGALFLALAVVKYDLLGVPLPHIVVKRGVVAGGALAILFIVAQVAQNFFSTEYGLIGGGVAAGGFLFAAVPIQRAIERMGTRSASAGRGAQGLSSDNERVYRITLGKFLADGRITPQEELDLAHLADQLGLTARRALELRQEAGRRKGAR